MRKRRFGGYLRRRTRDQEYGDEDPMGSVLGVEDGSPHVVRAPAYLVPGEDSDEGIKRHDREVDGQREQEVGDARPGRPNTIATADMVDEVHNVEEGHQRLPQKSAPILGRGKGDRKAGVLTGTRQIHPVVSSSFLTKSIHTSSPIAPASCRTLNSIATLLTMSRPLLDIGAAFCLCARSIFAVID